MDMNVDELDDFDRKILDVLAGDGRITVTALAERVGLSKTPCLNRMKRLQSGGYILGYKAVLNMEKLGFDHVAFTEVKLSSTKEADLSAFNAEVRKIPEVEQCYMTASHYDYLLKIRTPDIQAYRMVLGEKISSLPFVSSTSTVVAMQAVKQ